MPHIALKVARKYDQPVEQAYDLDFAYQVIEQSHDLLSVRLDAPQGPMGTSDYSIRLDATPLDRQRSREALEEIGVGDLADRPLYALSGGQHQRVLISRAIAAEPELLVLDEPTSAMDPAAERVLLELVERLKRAHDLSVVLVTHQLTAVAGFATEVALVDRQRGLFEVGPVKQMLDPKKLGRLYGREVRVVDVGGQIAITIGSVDGANGSARAPAAAEENQ